MVAKQWLGQLVMAPKSVTFRRHDHLVSVLFGDLLSHSYNITFSMFLDLVTVSLKLNLIFGSLGNFYIPVTYVSIFTYVALVHMPYMDNQHALTS